MTVTNRRTPADNISAVITGPTQGQIAVGTDIHQDQTVGMMGAAITEAQRAELAEIFAQLRNHVAAALPESDRPAALERLTELEAAVGDDKADVTTIEYVRKWFIRKLPTVAGMVGSVIAGPLVAQVVAAAGTKIGDSLV